MVRELIIVLFDYPLLALRKTNGRHSSRTNAVITCLTFKGITVKERIV